MDAADPIPPNSGDGSPLRECLPWDPGIQGTLFLPMKDKEMAQYLLSILIHLK